MRVDTRVLGISVLADKGILDVSASATVLRLPRRALGATQDGLIINGESMRVVGWECLRRSLAGGWDTGRTAGSIGGPWDDRGYVRKTRDAEDA